MKTKVTLRALVCSILLLIIGNAMAQTNMWIQRANFGGTGRQSAVSFSINSKGYICTGMEGASYMYVTNDLWEFDTSNVWVQKANFPGTARASATGFSIGDSAYVGGGIDLNGFFKIDFYRYDAVNGWSQIAPFPGGPRSDAVSFSVGGKGYVGLGHDASFNYNDFYQYDPSSNTWSAVASFPGGLRYGSVAFAIGNKGYVGLGYDGSSYLNDFWQYDHVTNTWSPKANFAGIPRRYPTGFSIGTNGYVGTGFNGTNSSQTTLNDFWRYDAVTNMWSQIINFPGSRYSATAFVIGNDAYTGTGRVGIGGFLQDIWKYTPDSSFTTGIQAHQTSSLTTFPNPATDAVTISGILTDVYEATIIDLAGKTVRHIQGTGDLTIAREGLPSGMYFAVIRDEFGKQVTVRFVFD